MEVHGQVNSKAIYKDFLPESLILRLNLAMLSSNAELLACQRHRKQLEKDNNRCSCHMRGTASDKGKLILRPGLILRLNLAMLSSNAELLACQRHRKQLEKDSNRCS